MRSINADQKAFDVGDHRPIVPTMDEQPTPANGMLKPLTRAEHREVIGQWRRIASSTDGERITHLDTPDDPVAYRLLDAAGEAIARGQVQNGVNILMLVARDYPRATAL
jgi:hypothetical protein